MEKKNIRYEKPILKNLNVVGKGDVKTPCAPTGSGATGPCMPSGAGPGL